MTEKKPVDWDELYPGRFLKSGELRGERVTLTISSVDLELLETEQGERQRGTVAFRETPRRLALNRTNGLCLRAMFGRAVQSWVGRRIVLFPTTTKLGGKTEACIRIWGSPDISSDMQVEIALPRRRPMSMTMHAVRDTERASDVDRIIAAVTSAATREDAIELARAAGVPDEHKRAVMRAIEERYS